MVSAIDLLVLSAGALSLALLDWLDEQLMWSVALILWLRKLSHMPWREAAPFIALVASALIGILGLSTWFWMQALRGL